MTTDDSTDTRTETAPWEESTCCVPMWVAGSPAGHCGSPAYGHQYPRKYLAEVVNGRYLFDRPAHCFGHCCPDHGGPAPGAVILYQDGYSEHGKPMWCAVMPGFVNLQESNAAFDENPVLAARKCAALEARK